MELIKNIFFNTDKLVENTKVKISYTGELFQKGCDKAFIHYGFGQNWEQVTDQPMTKTELGFQAEIEIISAETLNLCFKSGENEWDNNNNENYVFTIEPATLALTIVEDSDFKSLRKLRKTYLWSKKIKLAIYKIIRYIPKLISGNYTKKRASEE